MIKAFVFGKFLPFHKGHEAMINFALTKCDFLTVLICCSDKEKIDAPIRKNWLQTTFQSVKNIEINTYNYLESELPNTSVSSKEVSKIWSATFKTFFPDYDFVITSEEYGDYVATFMGIKHIRFDMERKLFPISATALRNDIFTYWNFLPDAVKPYFAVKIVLLGTESTGKTTLAQQLAHHFQSSLVKEAGRDIIDNSNDFEFNNLYLIAYEHARRIKEARLDKNPLLFIDTDIHITQSYAHFIFGKKLEIPHNIYDLNKADLYLYLNHDAPYIQDGTRLNETQRNLLHFSHKQILSDYNVHFEEISGNWGERFEKAVEQVNKLIETKRQKKL